MSEQDLKARIGDAWKAHYDGQHDLAVQKFRAIVAEAPDNVDANWGLGLSYRKAGDKQNALRVFQVVRDLVQARLEQTEERERYFMLNRMVAQQIEQMAEFI